MKENDWIKFWKEDNDLDRLQEFYRLVHPDDQTRQRIKEKAMQKLEIEEATRHHDSLSSNGFTNKDRRRLAFKSFFRGRFMSRRTVGIVAFAALLMVTVYFNANGFLIKNVNQVKVSGSNVETNALEASQTADTINLTSRIGPGQQNRDVGTVSEELSPQRIIYTLEANVKYEHILSTVSLLVERIEALKGYVSESRLNQDQNNHNAYLVLKVPIVQFGAFRSSLNDFGHVFSENLYTDDISQQYFDVETRLRSWEAQENRYLEIMVKANTVEEVLNVENALSNVRREIESLKGQLKYWDHRVQYSEIRLNLISSTATFTINDPWQPVSFQDTLQAAKNALLKSISFVWNALNYGLVLLGYILPAFTIALLLFPLYFIKKKGKKKV